MADTPTPQEMLTQVNAAITSVLAGGQSYKIGSRQLNRADLAKLYDCLLYTSPSPRDTR